MAYRAQRDDHPELRHGLYLGPQIRVAGSHLGRQGLVVGWKTFHAVADAAVQQDQPVSRGDARGRIGDGDLRFASRQSEFGQRTVQQRPGTVSSERPVAGVGAVQTRSQAHHQNRRRKRAEGWNRQAGVTRMARMHCIAKICQASTATTMRVIHTHIQTVGACAA